MGRPLHGGLAGKGQSAWREVRRGRTGIKLLTESRCESEEQSVGAREAGGRGSEELPHVGWDFCLILRAPSALRARVGRQDHQKTALYTRFHHSYPISPQEVDSPSTPGLWMKLQKVPCSGQPAVLWLLMKIVSIVFGGVGARAVSCYLCEAGWWASGFTHRAIAQSSPQETHGGWMGGWMG